MSVSTQRFLGSLVCDLEKPHLEFHRCLRFGYSEFCRVHRENRVKDLSLLIPRDWMFYDAEKHQPSTQLLFMICKLAVSMDILAINYPVTVYIWKSVWMWSICLAFDLDIARLNLQMKVTM